MIGIEVRMRHDDAFTRLHPLAVLVRTETRTEAHTEARTKALMVRSLY